LAAYVMVKFYGVIFLGRPREPHLAYARDAGPLERIALASLALGCIVLGLFPVNVLAILDQVNSMLIAATVSHRGESWLLLAPINGHQRYWVKAEDHLWYRLYLPIARSADWLARLVGWIQQGRISVYLMYSFVTLLALLFFVQWR